MNYSLAQVKSIKQSPLSQAAYFNPHFKVSPLFLPFAVDLSGHCSPIATQGDLGSCTGNAIAGALEYLENAKQEFVTGHKFIMVSRLFIYYNERVLERSVNLDAGATVEDGIRVLAKYGACDESLWPYDVTQFAVKPTVAAYDAAGTRKIKAYASVNNQDIQALKRVISAGYPIIFGFSVYDSFETPQVAATGRATLPTASDTLLGGHAALMVGYDDSSQLFKVRNSWGVNWGDNGYFYLPYAYVTNPELTGDAWVIS